MTERGKRAVTVEDIYRVDRSAVERQLGHPIKTLAPWEPKKSDAPKDKSHAD